MRTTFVRKRSSIIAVVIITTILLTIHHSSHLSYDEHQRHHQEELLMNTPRICCTILTSPGNLLTRAQAINDTWAPRCDRYFFITELPDRNLTKEQISTAKNLPIAPVKNITGGYRHLTEKSTLGFLFAYKHYINDCEWFVKADDDTYLIIENLKAFLREQNSSEPVTFGYNFKVISM